MSRRKALQCRVLWGQGGDAPCPVVNVSTLLTRGREKTFPWRAGSTCPRNYFRKIKSNRP